MKTRNSFLHSLGAGESEDKALHLVRVWSLLLRQLLGRRLLWRGEHMSSRGMGGGGTKQGRGERPSLMVYFMRAEASWLWHLSTGHLGFLVTLQIKFLTLEFGRAPSDPGKGFATLSVRPKCCPVGCGKATSQLRCSVAYDVACGGCWPAMAL